MCCRRCASRSGDLRRRAEGPEVFDRAPDVVAGCGDGLPVPVDEWLRGASPLGSTFQARGGDLDAHGLAQRDEPAHRPDHDGQLIDETVGVGVKVIEALQVTIADPRAEDQCDSVTVGYLVDVAEVLECRGGKARTCATTWRPSNGLCAAGLLNTTLSASSSRIASRSRASTARRKACDAMR